MPEKSPFDLELISVSKTYDQTAVLNNVSFALRKGEFLSLLGPSGCGKTTTLSMIAGFEVPTSGTINIRNRQVEALPPERRNIGMVFQNYALFPHMTVAQNIGFGLRMRGVSAAEIAPRASEAAKLVKVEHLLDRQPRQLSGGQQQRVALARALIVAPDILLLDEPFGALDRLLREELQIEVRALLRRLGITTVFVTHDQDEALSMSDRVAVMFAGRIEQIAAPQTLYDVPATQAVAGFIGKATIIPGRIEGTPPSFVSAAGTFALPRTETDPQPGEAAYFIRPEAIDAAQQPGSHPNTVTGVVVATTFLGDRRTMIVETAGAQRFLVTAERGAPQLSTGMQVNLGWSSAHAALFQNDKRL